MNTVAKSVGCNKQSALHRMFESHALSIQRITAAPNAPYMIEV